MHARVGHVDALEALMRDVGDRHVTGSATELGSSSEVGLLRRASRGLTELHGRRETECNEAADAIVGADGIGDHESQLA